MTATPTLSILCAGAAKGLVEALHDEFLRETGAAITGRFGAVGAMQEALLAGEPCDVMIVTAAMVDALCADGVLRGDARADLGRVRTGVAVRAHEPVPDVSSPDALRAALLAARTLYFPDPVRATAGIHFDKVMRQLGVHEALQSRCRTFPNGATAMRELASSSGPQQLGCTQISEILYTPGVQLAGPLPDPFELATLYTAAVSGHAAQPALAERFVARLAGPATRALRERGGFELA
ncbi:substrate-binding domain-containing protein [Ideonella sp. A 288]|uniref:molybdate ABC transporter substrate-binding protein n=1 Tax=Ideonella sp. A 288 TaxID=1962181 RepID=UPI000B4BF20B|nr:substrate-binding domain-containing protein [Ideonella sp. A 288]